MKSASCRWFGIGLAVAWSWMGPASGTAHAWGRLGHRVAGKLAESRLTPAARAAVRDLLEPGESLADASTWADEVRRDRPESGPWHYVNVPIDAPRYATKYCDDAGCVVTKIADYRRILADPDASREDRRVALRFVVHFIEDLHQPLHVGDRRDKGGNSLQVQFFGEGTNLHRLWDTQLLSRAGEGESQWVRDLSALATAEKVADWSRGSVEDWADESLDAARRAYQIPNSNQTVRPGTRLGGDYEAANLPVARLRLSQAGVRVAAVLNAIWE